MIEIKNDRDDHAVFIEILSLADLSPVHSVVVPSKRRLPIPPSFISETMIVASRFLR